MTFLFPISIDPESGRLVVEARSHVWGPIVRVRRYYASPDFGYLEEIALPLFSRYAVAW